MSSRLAHGLAFALGAMLVAAAVTACSSPGSAGPHIVASTNVWGSVAAAVAGPDIPVQSLIQDSSADPHSYQTTPGDAAAIRDAALVVVNGGHYDEFAERAAAGRTRPTIDAFALRAGAARGDDNEHVWYDLPTVAAVAARIATELGGLDPAHATAYSDRAQRFQSGLQETSAATAALAAAHPKAPVLQTEPLGHYLLLAAGLEDRTPHAFQQAVEQGNDPSPVDLAAVQKMVRAKAVRALIDNAQTEGSTTRELASVAKTAGVPVVRLTETLPPDTDYLRWQNGNVQALATALGP